MAKQKVTIADKTAGGSHTASEFNDIKNALNNNADELDVKVDKVTGKGLSEEDYTTAEKNKLAGVETGAEVNTVSPSDISGKQNTLVSGTNIKTINSESLLGSGDISISGSGDSIEINGYATLADLNAVTPTSGTPVALVTNDGANNGYYRWDGTSSWVKADDIPKDNIDSDNTAEPVNGKAVTDYVSGKINNHGYFGIAFRKVNPAYHGPCIKVRRSSDDTVQDIGFFAGKLNIKALMDFVGTTVTDQGFIHTIYEQFNGFDVIQTDNLKQPKIVKDGVLSTTNGKVSVDFSVGAVSLVNPDFTLQQPFSYSMVVEGGEDGLLNGQGGSSDYNSNFGGDFQLVSKGTSSITTTPSAIYDRQTFFTVICDGANSSIRFDGQENVAGDIGTGGFNGILIGRNNDLNRYGNGRLQEIVIYKGNISSYVKEKEKQIAQYYYDLPNKANIVLVSGQSNADGRMPINANDVPPYINGKPYDIPAYVGGYSISKYNPATFHHHLQDNGSWSFADIVIKKLDERYGGVIVNKHAIGGTAIYSQTSDERTLSADYDAVPAGKTKEFEIFENNYLELVELLDRYGIEYNTIAMIWHQGERDGALGYSAFYEAELLQIISRARQFTNNPKLPFVYGTQLTGNTESYDITIEAAQFNIASNDRYAYCRDNSDLNNSGTSSHFSITDGLKFAKWCIDLF